MQEVTIQEHETIAGVEYKIVNKKDFEKLFKLFQKITKGEEVFGMLAVLEKDDDHSYGPLILSSGPGDNLKLIHALICSAFSSVPGEFKANFAEDVLKFVNNAIKKQFLH